MMPFYSHMSSNKSGDVTSDEVAAVMTHVGVGRLHCIALIHRSINSALQPPQPDDAPSPLTAELSTDFSISLTQRSRSFGDSSEYLSSSSSSRSTVV